ncbi:hypothetical protein [Eubacterium xylanophilum]|uniref:hypothetical protein n=1 Tax=Eubacterium xylanophilum TaxID=39497 RepID=UPI00047D322F|nr:hypothetical protein [Eubacterium xylanophilum]
MNGKKKRIITLEKPKISGVASNIHIKVARSKKSKSFIMFKFSLSKKYKKSVKGISCKYSTRANEIVIKIPKGKGNSIKVSWSDSGDNESSLESPEYYIVR